MSPLVFAEQGPKDAPAIVLLHAFPFSGSMWRDLVPVLCLRYRCVVPDLRGFGSNQPRAFAHTFEHWALDTLALLDQLQLRSAHLLGLSMGGYVALRVSEIAPERVESLVLAHTQVRADSDENKRKRSQAIDRIIQDGVSSFGRSFLEGAMSKATLSGGGSAFDAALSSIEQNQGAGLTQALVALATRTDTSEALRALSCPVTLLSGEDDRITPPQLQEEMKLLAPQANWIRLAGVGHLGNFEAPAAFQAAVLAHYEQMEATKSASR